MFLLFHCYCRKWCQNIKQNYPANDVTHYLKLLSKNPRNSSWKRILEKNYWFYRMLLIKNEEVFELSNGKWRNSLSHAHKLDKNHVCALWLLESFWFNFAVNSDAFLNIYVNAVEHRSFQWSFQSVFVFISQNPNDSASFESHRIV